MLNFVAILIIEVGSEFNRSSIIVNEANMINSLLLAIITVINKNLIIIGFFKERL